MTLQTFGPVLVQDPRTKKGVPVTTALVTDPATGDAVATFDLDGNPRSVTTDSRGIASQWKADPPNGVLYLDFAGVVLAVISLEYATGLPARVDALELLLAGPRLDDLEARVAALEAGGGGGSTGDLIITDNGAGTLSTSSLEVSDPGTGTLSTTSTVVSDPGTGILSAA